MNISHGFSLTEYMLKGIFKVGWRCIEQFLDKVKANAEKNLETLSREGEKYWGKHHYVLVRKKYGLKELVGKVRHLIEFFEHIC